MRRHHTGLLVLLLLLVFGGIALVVPAIFRPQGPHNGLVQVRRVSAHMMGDSPSISVSGNLPACTTIDRSAVQRVGTTITMTYTTRPESTFMIGTRPLPLPVCRVLAGFRGGSGGFTSTTRLDDDLPPGVYTISANGVTETLRVSE